MFRLTQYMSALLSPNALVRRQASEKSSGPVVIWNLTRRCNLTCKHCYATSADKLFPGELSLSEISSVMKDLQNFRVPVLILSGGEPLLHPHIFEISKHARAAGFYVGLSSNGTLIRPENIDQLVEVGYNYVGISIDGMQATHDRFRRREGAFKEALEAIRLCRQAGIKVGLRFTLTTDNARELPEILELMTEEGVEKFYLSHLNYAGRGNKNRADDAHFNLTREAMELLFQTCWEKLRLGQSVEFVTGNNDADAVFLLHWIRRHHPQYEAPLLTMLSEWGGNASGVNVANIDNIGNVHPDTMWWDYSLGNVRQRPFSEIWQDCSDPLLAGLKQKPRAIEGRCGECAYFSLCGGNSRTRAWQLSGNPWAEDPGCYLTDDELGIRHTNTRLKLSPYHSAKRRQAESPVWQNK